MKKSKINKITINDILRYRTMLRTVYKRNFSLEQTAAILEEKGVKNFEE